MMQPPGVGATAAKTMHRVGYATVKTLLALSVVMLPTPPLHPHKPSGVLISAVIVLCSFAYAWLQGSDPGYITDELLRRAMEVEDEEGNLITTEEEDDDDDEIHRDELRSPAKNAEKNYRERRIEQIRAALKQSQEEEEHDVVLSLEQQPLAACAEDGDADGNDAFCDECSLFRPLRSHHCRFCGKCVAMFDHHCHLVGTCIGEKNHVRFWWFLLLQSLELLVGLAVVSARFQQPKHGQSWAQANGWQLLLLSILALLLVFVGSMLAFHTFLAMSSMTTYEVGRGTDKISYLRGFRECDLPFSRGLLANLAFFCCPQSRPSWLPLSTDSNGHVRKHQPWRPTLWKLPTPILDRDSDKICENLWENKYYSCC